MPRNKTPINKLNAMERTKKKKNGKKSSHVRDVKQYKGKFEITRSGMGFLVVEGLEKDVIIRPNEFNRAFHGDYVRCEIIKGDLRSGRLQGKVTQIIERKQKQFAGVIEVNRDYAFFLPSSEKPLPNFFISLSNLNKAKDGQRVFVELISWEKDDKRPSGRVVEIITENKEADLAMKEILVQQGFSLQFSEDAIEEAERIPDLVPNARYTDRHDMRDILTFTIDPADAKDFDDALSYRILNNGNTEIGIHIADVSYYIEEDSALDDSAYERATSVYLPDRVVPMLPERISNELCSLRPNEDKLTYSCNFIFDNKGKNIEKWIGRTVIHSNHRFTYEDVQTIIETGNGIYEQEILALHTLAQSIRKARMKEGAINFSSQEVRFKLDDTGKPIGIIIKESKESHQLIEEFMLLANRTVAEKVSSIKVDGKPIPFPYRVHDHPDEEKLVPFVEFAKKHGYQFSTRTPREIAKSFNELLLKVQGMPEQRVLEQLGIRTMAKAIYTSKNIGHYGLGFEDYCHFTSPIRRYPDVLVHRVMTQILQNQVEPDKKMEEKCRHSSERERAAMESERAANKYKQVEFMKDHLGETFNAVISGVASFGFWAETLEHKCEGLVSLTALLDYDDFIYYDQEYALVGKRSGKTFTMGDTVQIKVISANLSKRQLDYEWILSAEDQSISTSKKKK
jgi:ribonuclease R